MDHKKPSKENSNSHIVSPCPGKNKKASSLLCCSAVDTLESQNVYLSTEISRSDNCVDDSTSGTSPQPDCMKNKLSKKNRVLSDGLNSKFKIRSKTKHNLKWILSCFRTFEDETKKNGKKQGLPNSSNKYSKTNFKCCFLVDSAEIEAFTTEDKQLSIISLRDSPVKRYSTGNSIDVYSESSFAPSGSKSSKFEIIDDPSKLFPRSKSDSQIIDNINSPECEQFSSLNDIEHHKTSVLFNISGKKCGQHSKRQTIQLMATDGSLRTYSKSTLTPLDDVIFDDEKIFKHLNLTLYKNESNYSTSSKESSSGSDNAFIQDDPPTINSHENIELQNSDMDSSKKTRAQNICYFYEPEVEDEVAIARPPTPSFIFDKTNFKHKEIALGQDDLPIERKVSIDDGYHEEMLDQDCKFYKNGLDSEDEDQQEYFQNIHTSEMQKSKGEVQKRSNAIFQNSSNTTNENECYVYDTTTESLPNPTHLNSLGSAISQNSIGTTKLLKLPLKNSPGNDISLNYGYKSYIVDRYFNSDLPSNIVGSYAKPLPAETCDSFNHNRRTDDLDNSAPERILETQSYGKSHYPRNSNNFYETAPKVCNKQLSGESCDVIETRNFNQTTTSTKLKSIYTDSEFSKNSVHENIFAYPRKLRKQIPSHTVETSTDPSYSQSRLQRFLKTFRDSDDTVLTHYFIDGPLKNHPNPYFRIEPIGAEK